MRDRKPFQLKRTMVIYNAFQVAISAYMFYEVCQTFGGDAPTQTIEKLLIELIHFCLFLASCSRMAELQS